MAKATEISSNTASVTIQRGSLWRLKPYAVANMPATLTSDTAAYYAWPAGNVAFFNS